jgi:hypothetical protein
VSCKTHAKLSEAIAKRVEQSVNALFPDGTHGIREAARWGFDMGFRQGYRHARAELAAECAGDLALDKVD